MNPLLSVPARPAPPPSLLKSMREDLRCVQGRDPAARSLFEVMTIYPGVQAVLLYRLAHSLWRRGWLYTARWLSFIARLITNVDIHPAARIGQRFFIDHGAGVVIGETAEIGDEVTLYHGVTLGGTTWNPGKRHPTLGDGVVVGAGAKILGAITVGAGARVAANSVVIEDVLPGMTVVGIPGRMVLPREHRRLAAPGIDLDHHLMPDPVGKAIACLLERIGELEHEVLRLSGSVVPSQRHSEVSQCADCTDACAEGASSAAPWANRSACKGNHHV
ncbi:serine O-acetyltransferase [Solimonas aquatica]|uniref:serine O-acetyltransferase n=2 Tax=Solimonas aquatica TaxID=489703 RepID=A0A1H9IQV3_9GAMM|nr:serine O-acetyltransferase [Solimonas aquatica]SEQ76918.1 serine O-acetyltransferase [Solimonas aquatica]